MKGIYRYYLWLSDSGCNSVKLKVILKRLYNMLLELYHFQLNFLLVVNVVYPLNKKQ